MKISVALAYYDGAEYIEEQLASIMNQFGAKDELILSVDRAFDGSMDLLKSWEEKDGRIFLTTGPRKGIVKNYEHAIRMCSGDVIFICGQDDVWHPDKIKKMKRAFHDKAVMAVLHDGIITDENLQERGSTLFEKNPPGKGLVRNIWKDFYVDPCLAFRRELKEGLLPFPEQVYRCGSWIGAVAALTGEVVFLEEPLLLYRQYDKKMKEEQRDAGIPGSKLRLDMLQAVLKRRNEWKNEK